MRLQVTQENLSKALGSVAKVANTRNTLPILGNVLLKTVDNRLSVSATNLDIGITYLIGSKISKEGSITVPARLMQDFVSNLPSGIIDLELDDYKLHVSSGKYKSTINGISAEEFPVMPDIGDATSMDIDSIILKKAIQQTVFASSSDETRPVLTGVYMYSHENDLFMVSTDSYRLAEKNLISIKQDVNLLIPSGAMQDLLRIIGDSSETVHIVYDDQQILFRVGEVDLVGRLIDGKYPPYRKLIPEDFEVEAVLSRSDFLNITKVSALFARESAGSITIKVDEISKQVSIDSVASQVGENTSSADAVVVGSGEVTINSRYLLDALNVFDGEKVKFSFNGKLDPILVTDPANKDYKHIIMPLRS